MKADYRQGDYRVVADRLRPAAERLVSWTAPTGLVVDVAAGTGNVSGAVLAAGASAVAVDVVPEQLQLGREVQGTQIAWVAGDAVALPLREGVADAALSTFGVIYVEDAAAALQEMARVCKPGAVLGLTAWAQDGYQAASAAALSSALGEEYGDGHLRRWGTPKLATAHLACFCDQVEVRREPLRSPYRSLEAWWDTVSTSAPPLVTAAQRVSPEAFQALGAELRSVVRAFSHEARDGFVLQDEFLMARGRVRP